MYFLGSVSGASGAANNQQSGGFDIPPSTRALYLMASATGVQFELGVATGGTGSTFQTTQTRAGFLDGPNLLCGPFRVIQNAQGHPVVSIYNTTGGNVSVRVYMAPTT